jgi:hypothetical protein
VSFKDWIRDDRNLKVAKSKIDITKGGKSLACREMAAHLACWTRSALHCPHAAAFVDDCEGVGVDCCAVARGYPTLASRADRPWAVTSSCSQRQCHSSVRFGPCEEEWRGLLSLQRRRICAEGLHVWPTLPHHCTLFLADILEEISLSSRHDDSSSLVSRLRRADPGRLLDGGPGADSDTSSRRSVERALAVLCARSRCA